MAGCADFQLSTILLTYSSFVAVGDILTMLFRVRFCSLDAQRPTSSEVVKLSRGFDDVNVIGTVAPSRFYAISMYYL